MIITMYPFIRGLSFIEKAVSFYVSLTLHNNFEQNGKES